MFIILNRMEKDKMVSTKEALESKYVNAELVKTSQSKKLVILGEGSYEDVTYEGETSRRLTLPVQIDGKDKIWRPNKDSVVNLNTFGDNTAQWVGKVVIVSVIRARGKEMVIGRPE